MRMRSLVVLAGLVLETAGAMVPATGLGQARAAEPAAEKGPVYAQLSSMATQQPKEGKPIVVTMESNDALNGIGHDTKQNPGEITVKTPGVYFVVAAIQVGKETGDSDEYVDVWLRQNGKDVDNSGCRQAVKDQKFTTVLVSQGIAECKAGDVFNVMISASAPDKGLGIIATKPQGEATIPSIIFSMYKIN